MTVAAEGTWIQRHPKSMAVILLLATITLMLAVLEFAFRAFLKYQPSYYSAIEGNSGISVYPFGEIIYNSFGFPDSEFLLDDPRRRVGYVGDSVTRGVGAGYGYRITEVLEEYYPHIQHMNLSQGVGTGMDRATIDQVLELSAEFDLDVVVYLMNLNDILPDQPEDETEVTQQSLYRQVKDLLGHVDVLRGRSYLYTAVRNTLKDLLVRNGIGVAGLSYEFDPDKHAAVIEDTAGRVRLLDQLLSELGVEFITVIIPYEMQISADAERVYRELGIDVNEGFVQRSTQKALIEALPGIRVIDAAGAFLDRDGGRPARVGEYFVYNRGGRLDWNHPTRPGHRKIAEFLVEERLFSEAGE